MAFKAISLNEASGKIQKVKASEVMILEGSLSVSESVSVQQDVTIQGNLTVLGASSEIEIKDAKILDAVIDLGMEDNGLGGLGLPTVNSAGINVYGFQLNYWDGAAPAIASIKFDKTSMKWTFIPGLIVSDLEGNASTATTLLNPQDFEISGDIVAAKVSFDGSAGVNLVSVIQPQAVEFSMMDSAAYRDSVEAIRGSLTASDTEFATEKAIALFVEGAVSNLSSNLQAELDATQVAVIGSDTTASYVYAPPAGSNYLAAATSMMDADAKLDAQIALVQGELDGTQTGAGLAADGSYTAVGTRNYIGAATSLDDADAKLDAAIKVNEDAIAQEVTDRTQAITDLKFVGIGSSNQSVAAPLVLTIEDLDSTLSDADLRLASNYSKRLGFTVKGTALTNNYMVIDANGTSKDFEWSMSIEENGANFPAQGAASQGTFASTQAIVDYVQAELSTLQAAITAASQWDYDVNGAVGTLDFASGESFKITSSGSYGILASVDPLTDTVHFELDANIATEHLYFSKELVQDTGVLGSVAAYELLKSDLSVPTDNAERVFAMSAGVSPDGNQLIFVNGQVIQDMGAAVSGFAVGDDIFLSAGGQMTNVAPSTTGAGELIQIGKMTAAGLYLEIRHIMTY